VQEGEKVGMKEVEEEKLVKEYEKLERK